MKKEILASALLGSLLLSGCTSSSELNKPGDAEAKTSINYENVRNTQYDKAKMDEDYIRFAFNLYNKSQAESDGNMMISPASIMFALDLTAAGANGETLDQIMALYNGEKDPETQLAFARDWMNRINNSEDVDFSVANSFWINEDKLGNNVNSEYLKFIEESYRAEITTLPFDGNTPDKINKWIDKSTKGMIKKAIDTLNPSTSDVLVNAICFEGKWWDPYEEFQIKPGMFNSGNGEQEVNYLISNEYTYLESDSMTGFMKYYDGGEYAFLAMLPKDENTNISDFAAGLGSDEYIKFWNSRTREYDVRTKIPEFTSEYNIDLVGILQSMGMTTAFDPNNADFKGMADLGDKNIFVSDIFHKSFVQVDRNGTKAAAVTVVTKDVATAMEDEPEYKVVYLDRPFAYAIVDAESGSPIFIGTVDSVKTPEV